MQNLSDKELDELMKKANESQSYPYDADSWAALSDKLDKTPKRGFASGHVPLLIVLASVLLISSLYFVVPKQAPISDSVVASMVLEKEQERNQATNTEKVTQAPTNSTAEKTLVKDESNRSSEKKGYREALAYVRLEKSSKVLKPSNANMHKSTVESDGSSQPREREENVSNTEKQQTLPVSTKYVRATSLAETAIIDSATVERVEVEELKHEINTKDSVREKKVEKAMTNRFAVKLSISPDFSSESFSQTDAVGWNYGGAVEYQITKAFAVSLGLLNTRKYYTAEDVTYGQYTAEFAEGDCNMWDIPVNVHYYIPSRQSLQLIGSLGFSSYIMKQENYTYYPDETDKDRKYYSEINNENSEWFKILNVSMAAQLQVSPAVYIQLEPFIKAPLTGLGEGNISLSSFGTFFTVKYQLFTQNSRSNDPKK